MHEIKIRQEYSAGSVNKENKRPPAPYPHGITKVIADLENRPRNSCKKLTIDEKATTKKKDLRCFKSNKGGNLLLQYINKSGSHKAK